MFESLCEYLKKIGGWWTMLVIPILKYSLGLEVIPPNLPLYNIISAIPAWVIWVVLFVVFFFVNLKIFHDMRIDKERLMRTYLEEAEKNKGKWPFITDLKMSKIAWGLWYTGTMPQSERAYDYNILTRVLLLKPDSDIFKEVMEKSGEDPQLAANKINTFSRSLLEKGVKVGLYSYVRSIPVSMTIFDMMPCRRKREYIPNSSNAWIVAKTFVRDVGVSNRPMQRIKRNDPLFNPYFTDFEEIWAGSDRVVLDDGELKIDGKWGNYET